MQRGNIPKAFFYCKILQPYQVQSCDFCNNVFRKTNKSLGGLMKQPLWVYTRGLFFQANIVFASQYRKWGPIKLSTLPFVSVVMPAHNEEQYIGDCLKALCSQNYPTDQFEVIVVNNNSTDRTADIASAHGAIVIDQRQGPVGAVRNAGVLAAKGDIIAFIDSDCVAPADWIKNGVELIASRPGCAFGGGCYLREKPYPIERFWLLSNNNEATLPKHLLGATIFVRKDDFIRAGMFDVTITSGEDTKLTECLMESGTDVRFVQSLSVAHLGNPITIPDFFKRQIWHSENYLRNLRDSLVDPVFYLILGFYFMMAAGLIITLTLSIGAGLAVVMASLLLPLVLTIKRILRARYKLQHPSDLLYIYWLDLVYVVARCFGLTKGLMRR